MGRLRHWVFKTLFRREISELEREIGEEFRSHIEMKAEALQAGGMGAEEAHAEAVQRFGDSDRLREACVKGLLMAKAHERRVSRLDWLSQDLKDGARQFFRRPGFSLLASGTLAVGLATSTAVFTYVNAYRQPLPGADSRGSLSVIPGHRRGAVRAPVVSGLPGSGRIRGRQG